MTITKEFASKLAVAFVAVAMVFSAFATSAKAQTSTEDLQALINDLLAQVAALQASTGHAASASSVCPYTWTRDLDVGATSADVMVLQQFLNGNGQQVAAAGAGSAGSETEYYGPATAAAVSAFQEANRATVLSPVGLVSGTGYFGPSTRAAANAACVSAPVMDDSMDDADDSMMDDEDDSMMDDEDDDDDAPVVLKGEGEIKFFETDSASDDEIEEGLEDAEITTVKLQFRRGSVELTRIDLALESTDTVESDPWDTFETISLWIDGDKIAEKDADDEDEYLSENAGSLRFSGFSFIGISGQEYELVVKATVQNSVDGTSDGNDWTVEFDAIRFFDGDGVATTDTSSKDIGNAAGEAFSIVEEGSDDELTIRSSTNDPDSTTIQLEDDQTSDWETIFAFDLDTDDSINDIHMEGIRIDVVATEDGTLATSTINLIDDVQLVVNGEVMDDVTPTHGTTGMFVFDLDDDDFDIDAGDRVEVEFQVEFEALTTLFEGATVKATTNTTGLAAEGADNLAGAQLSGSATGEEHTLRTEGAILAAGSESETLKINDDADTTDDEGVFVISFDVTAFETDLYLNKTAASGTAMGTAGASFLVEDNSGNAVGAGTSSASLTSTADTDGTRFIVNEGETETFTLTVEYDPATAGFYQLQLYSLNFNNSNADPDTAQRALDESDYETDALSI